MTRESTIQDVLDREGGRDVLYVHGYDAGEGFSDALSRYVSLEQASRTGRIRDVDGLLDELDQQ